MRADPVLNHIWIPDQSLTEIGYAQRGVPPYTIKINGQSWRMNGDVEPSKQAGSYRIFYIGDSFIEGTCPEEDTVPAIVRRELKLPGVDRIEVVNAGTSSYSPTLYYLLVKSRILGLSPDLLVVNLDMTDVFDDSLYRATLLVDEKGAPAACPAGHPLQGTHQRKINGLERVRLLERWVKWLQTRSDLAWLLIYNIESYYRTHAQGDSRIPRSFAWCAFDRSKETEEAVSFSMEMLARLIRLARESGVKVVLTAVPHRQQLEGLWSQQPMIDLALLCEREGVPFLNPVQAMRGRLGPLDPEAIYIPNDMHFNPRGYRMWAEVHLEFLRSLNLPQGRSSNKEGPFS